MTNRKLILASILVIAAFAGWFLSREHSMSANTSFFLKGEFEEESEQEASRKRAEYEWKLQRDPRTGKIPARIRAKELEWVKTIPFRDNGRNNPLVNNTYVPVGPTQYGGRTRALAYDVRFNGTTNRVMLSGGVNGGIFRSTDAGATWAFVHPIDEVRSVTCLAQDPRPGFQDTWYAGTGEAIGTAYYPNAFVYGFGIFKSTDNGLTWAKLPSTVGATSQFEFDNPFDIVHRIAVNPVNGHVYAALQQVIGRSTDGGTTWESSFQGTTNTTVFGGITEVLINNDGSRLFATVSGRNPDRGFVGVWTSTTGNSGSWTRIAGGLNGQTDSVPGWRAYNNNTDANQNFTGGWGRVVLALAPSNQNQLYVLCENALSAANSESEADFFVTDVSGSPLTWSNRTASLVAKRNGTTDSYYEAQFGYNMVVAVHPTLPNIVFVGGVNLFKSIDGFATQSNTSFAGGRTSTTYDDPNQYSHVDIHALAFEPGNTNRLIVASDGGMIVTQNSVTGKILWENLNSQYQTIQYYNIGIDPTPGSRTYFGGAQDNSTTFRDVGGLLGSLLPDSNDHYILIGGDGGQVGMTKKNAMDQQFLFGSVQEGQIIRVKLFPPFDNTFLTLVKPANTGPGEFFTYYLVDEDNTNLLYFVLSDTLYRTVNSSTVTPTTWTRMNGIHQTLNGSIFSMATTNGVYTPNSQLFMGTGNGKIYRFQDPQNAAITATPTEITPPTMTSGSVVIDLAVNPRNHDTLLAVVSNYNVQSVFWTGNATAINPTWQGIQGNIDTPSVRCCAIVATTTGVEYYIGTTVGLFSTTTINSSSTQWTRENAGAMTTAIVQSLAYRWVDNTLVAGTHGNGMFAAYIGNAINIPTAVNDPIRNDKNFIKAAFPTITSDIISYQIGNMFTVRRLRIQVANMGGQIIYDKETGYQSGTVDVRGFPRGAYILTVTSNDRKYQFVQKFVK